MSRTLGNGNIRRINEGVPLPDGKTISTWHYATNDLASAVEAAGFFNDMRNSASVGDIIIASLDLDGTPVLKNYMFTAVPASGNVTVALQTTTAG